MKCPRCKRNLEKGTRFCPACGTRIVRGTGRRIVALLLVLVILLGIGGITDLLLKTFGNGKGLKDLIFQGSGAKIQTAEEAIDHARLLGEICGYKNAMEELTIKTETTVDGDSYYRLQQNYQGIPVFGKTLVLVTDDTGSLFAVTGNVDDVAETVSLTPSATQDEIQRSVEGYILGELCASASEISVSEPDESDLYIYNNNGISFLVYSVDVCCRSPSDFEIYQLLVNARSADVVAAYSRFQSYQKMSGNLNGQSVTHEAVDYSADNGTGFLIDEERGISAYSVDKELIWSSEQFRFVKVADGENDISFAKTLVSWDQNSEPNKSSVDAYVHTQIVYDYFYSQLGHKSVDGGGLADISVVAEMGYARKEDDPNRLSLWAGNAYSYCTPDKHKAMLVFGTGKGTKPSLSSSIDVVAHEYMHSVEAFHSNLIYRGESGAISEGLSDIFGELVQAWHTNKADWIHGKRNLIDPTENAYPAMYHGAYWVNPDDYENDKGGVHANSTVISHAAYLMSNGIDGTGAHKLSNKDLAVLWYRAMLMMPSDCTFPECRQYVEWAASSMKNLTDAQRLLVSQAFDAVGIRNGDTEETTVDYQLSPGSTLSVFDQNGEKYVGYHLRISGYTDELGVDVDKLLEGRFAIWKGKPYEKDTIIDEAPAILNLPGGTYHVAISASDHPDHVYSFTISVNRNYPHSNITLYTDFQNPLVVHITDSPDSAQGVDAYSAYQAAAEKTTASGCWRETMSLTADMDISKGSAKAKTTVTMTSDTDISNYSKQAPSGVRMAGEAEMHVMGETYAWTMRYENGTAHYQYTQPMRNSVDIKMDPGFFDFGTITSEMLSDASVVGNKIRFTIDGSKMTEAGIAAVKQMNGVEDVRYGDVAVVITLNAQGGMDTISMNFKASLKLQGYDAKVDYQILYRYSESSAGADSPSTAVIPGIYVNEADKFNTLTIQEVSGKEVRFTVWWYRTWDISDAAATLSGNAASFSYTSASNLQAEGTLRFQEDTAVLTLTKCGHANVDTGEYRFRLISRGFPEEQLNQIKKELQVPDSLQTDITQGEPVFWEDGGFYCTRIDICHDGKFVAGADVDSLTGTLVGNITRYSGGDAGAYAISETEAFAIACKYWDFTEGDVDSDTGYPLNITSDGIVEGNDGRFYYAFRYRWLVIPTGITSTLEYLYVDAETGECLCSIQRSG